MLRRALLGSLARRPWARRLTSFHGPLARAASPRVAALRMNSSNRATGSGLAHSPSAHALYQPTEPEAASRTSARQLVRRTIPTGPGPPPPSGRKPPSGSVRSSRPSAMPASIPPSTLRKPPANNRAASPPPVARPRSAPTRCLPRWSIGSDLARLLGNLPGLAARDERLKVGWLALGDLGVLLEDRALEGRARIVVDHAQSHREAADRHVDQHVGDRLVLRVVDDDLGRLPVAAGDVDDLEVQRGPVEGQPLGAIVEQHRLPRAPPP